MAIHANLPDSELHEPKGAGAATNKQILISNGDTTTQFTELVYMGWWDYNDATTAGTPITLSAATTWFPMTNDEAGANTNKTYKLPLTDDLWDVGTQKFDWTGLELGDTVLIRYDFTVTTTGTNHTIGIRVSLAETSGSPYQLDMLERTFKTAGTYSITGVYEIYMGDSNTRDYPATIEVSSDTGTTNTVVVNGWFVKATKIIPQIKP